MEVVHHDGLEVHNHSNLEAVPNLYHRYTTLGSETHPTAGKEFVNSESLPKKKICGLSRAIFWLAVALAALAIIVIGIAVGLGVALSKAQTSDRSINAPETATSPGLAGSSPTATPLSSTSAKSTSTISSSATRTATTVPTPSNICPGANNTVMSPGLGSVQYTVLCDSDFGGSGKQTLSSIVVATWDDCVKLCNTMNYFQQRSDVGCTWNVLGTGTQTPGTCWCLGGADKTVVANPGNIVAIPNTSSS